MMIHRAKVREPNSNPLIELGYHWDRGGEDFSVKSEDIEICHFVGHGPRGAGVYAPLVQKKGKVAIRTGLWVAGVNNEKAHEAQGHLGHLVVVRMVHVGTMLTKGEFVFEGVPGIDGFL